MELIVVVKAVLPFTKNLKEEFDKKSNMKGLVKNVYLLCG